MLGQHTENFIYWKVLNTQELLTVFILAITTILM